VLIVAIRRMSNTPTHYAYIIMLRMRMSKSVSFVIAVFLVSVLFNGTWKLESVSSTREFVYSVLDTGLW
jgi:hypothetical protein